jgi:hypothetical protein
MPQRLLTLLTVSLLASSCNSPAAAAPPAPNAKSSEPTELPKLWADVLPPLRNRDRFEFTYGSATVRMDGPPKANGEEPFPTDADAIAYLRSWLTTHFGPLPEQTDLVVDRIQHSASGGDQPSYDWDKGHTVVFTQTWRGIRTDRTAVLYLRGRSEVDGSIDIARFTPVEGSQRDLLSPAAAQLAVGRVLSALGQGQALPSKVPLTLTFIWESANETGERIRLRPVWMLGDGPFLIDAHTGEPGRNG